MSHRRRGLVAPSPDEQGIVGYEELSELMAQIGAYVDEKVSLNDEQEIVLMTLTRTYWAAKDVIIRLLASQTGR